MKKRDVLIENLINYNIMETKVLPGKKDRFKIILETSHRNWHIKVKHDGKIIPCTKKEIDDNIYSLSFEIKTNGQEIEVFLIGKKETILLTKYLYAENKQKYENRKNNFHLSSIIKIQDVLLSGISNPNLYIGGTSIYEHPQLKVLADGEMKTFTQIKTEDKKSFMINCEIPQKAKQLKFLISVNDQDILVFKIENRLFSRIKNRLTSTKKIFIYKIRNYYSVIKKGVHFLWKEHHFLIPPFLWKKYILLAIERLKEPNYPFYDPFNKDDYNTWLKINNEEMTSKKLKYNPLISIIIPVYNVERIYLKKCLDSILAQNYKHFEICLVDDASTKEETIKTLKEYEKKDERIRVKYRKKNGHISRASNDALAMAKGEFIGLVDNDDILAKNALYENVFALNQDKTIDMLYSDEDKINLEEERCDPHFKPDFSPDTLMSLNYICHFTVLRKSLVEEVGGFEIGLEGAQDHDLFLKISEKTKKIHHIPKILYHWRMLSTSTALNTENKNYANDKGKMAIENALKRRKLDGTVAKDPLSKYYIVTYNCKKEPLISIIIPTRDYADITEKCLASLFKKTTYPNYEVLLVNNNSKEKKTFALFNKYKNKYKNFSVIDANFEFNYSKLNNLAAKKSKAEYLVLLNNDTEIISPNWLEVMVGYASLSHIGCVGPKLLYPDETIQHGGVILGLGGVASHAYTGSKRNALGMYGRLRVPYNYGAVTAACLMISKKKFDEVKGLEERLQIAYNDMDFNIKLIQKGYYNIFLPQVELYHHESKSRGLDTTNEKYKRFLKESDFMEKQWGNILIADKMYNPNFTRKYWFVLDKNKKNEDEKND